jgi:DAK2 domain fusion protein YloV
VALLTDLDTVRASRQIRLAAELPHCDGLGLKQLTRAALTWLDANHKAVNALNVFPVPDGDTGTNMLLTMQAAYREIELASEANASRVAHAISHGALMGARGNSGVILSQIWRGFARGLGAAAKFDANLLGHALREASDTAYRGVVKPVEGTILTVIKDIAAAAEQAVANPNHRDDLRDLLETLVTAACASVDRTPDLMPLLKQAGVVDSGGKGLAVLLEGMLRYVRGQPLDASQAAQVVTLDLSAVGAALDAAEPGQEWEVVVDFRPRGVVHLPTLYDSLTKMGTSIQVGEGDGLYRIHIHLLRVKRHAPIELVEELGTVVKVHMENLLDQMPAEAAPPGDSLPLQVLEPGQVGVIAVSPGPGLSRILASLGAAAIVSGGQTMNPSTEDFLKAIDQLPTDRVLLLPNNKNIILAANQAADLSAKQVRVVPTRTVPQGIAALLQLLPDGDLDTVHASMERALGSIATGEVTTASRDVELDGVAVKEGQFIGLHNSQLKVAAPTLPEALFALVGHMQPEAHEIVTLYYGADVSAEAANEIAEKICAAHPALEVQVHAGGQPYYHYIVSLE